MKLDTLLTDLYAPLKGIEPRTIEIYRFTLKAWAALIGREPTLDDLEELGVAKFLAHRLRERSVATAAKDRCQVRALWEFAARRGLIDRWPQIRPIRVPERIPQAWLTDELQRLLEAASGRQGEIAGVPASAFWRAAILVCYETGCRVGELLGLEWRDVSPAGIVFRAENRKGKRRDIFRPLSPETAAALEAIRRPRDEVFAWDRCYTNLWRHLGMVCKAAGLPDDRLSKFHRLRKTHASYAAAAGLDAQRLLDHALPTTTKAYLDPRVVQPPAAPAVLPRVG